MATDHLLIRLAHRFPPAAPMDVDGWAYRRDLGAWVSANAPEMLMVSEVVESLSKEPRPQPRPQPRPEPRPMPMSKKADHETGEDMKGA